MGAASVIGSVPIQSIIVAMKSSRVNTVSYTMSGILAVLIRLLKKASQLVTHNGW